MHVSHCPRCGGSLQISIMSRFNTEIICLDCEAKERRHPDYPKAVAYMARLVYPESAHE